MASIAARELSRPFRTTTHRLAVAAVLGALLLPVASPYRVLCGVLAAGVTAGLVRLRVRDRPGPRCRPPTSGSGCATSASRPLPWTNGATEPGKPSAVDGSRLRVRTMGRDEWDTQLMVHVVAVPLVPQQREQSPGRPTSSSSARPCSCCWPSSTTSSVTPVVAVGMSRMGDAILATRIDGAELSSLRGRAESMTSCSTRLWAELAALHAAGLAHGGARSSAPSASMTKARVQLGSFVRARIG